MTEVKNPISKRLISTMIIVSTFFSIIATGVQLYNEYEEEKGMIATDLEQIKNSSIDSLRLSLWLKNDEQVTVQLQSLIKFKHLTYISIDEENGNVVSYGKNEPDDSIEQTYPIDYIYNHKEYNLGVLTLQGNLEHARNEVKNRFYLIAVTQIAKTFIVAFIMLYVFSYMLTNHLHKIAQHASKLIENNTVEPLQLDLKTNEDELELLQNVLNKLQKHINTKLEDIEKENASLESRNSILEEITKNLPNEEYITVTKKDADAIINVVEFLEDDQVRGDNAAIQRDLASLIILIKRELEKR